MPTSRPLVEGDRVVGIADSPIPIIGDAYYWQRSIQAWGLLHDAAEAYLGDMVRPIKQRMPEFKAIENRLLQRIAKRFDLAWPIPNVVFDADDIMLATEFRDLMHSPPQTPLRMQPIPPLPGWNAYLPPLAQTPFDTRQVFLYEAHRLGLK